MEVLKEIICLEHWKWLALVVGGFIAGFSMCLYIFAIMKNPKDYE